MKKPALSDFSNHSTRAEYCCSIQQRQAEASDIFSEFLNSVQSSTCRASAIRDARSNVTPSSHERIRDKLPLSISNLRDSSRMLSFWRANSLFTFFAKVSIAFNLAIVCTFCQAVLSNSTKRRTLEAKSSETCYQELCSLRVTHSSDHQSIKSFQVAEPGLQLSDFLF